MVSRGREEEEEEEEEEEDTSLGTVNRSGTEERESPDAYEQWSSQFLKQKQKQKQK